MTNNKVANRENLSQKWYDNPVPSFNSLLSDHLRGENNMNNTELAKIYTITNTVKNIVYVGSTTQSLHERFLGHIKQSRGEGRQGAFHDDLRAQPNEDFRIEQVDECFVRHRFIIEEALWHKLNEEGIALYDIKRGASHSKNTVQRLTQARQNNGFDYSSEEFKDKMSQATRGEKNGMFNRKDEQAVNGRAVFALNDKEEVVHTFPSVKVALKFLGLKGHGMLVRACREGFKYKGYYWKKEWVDR